MSELYSGKKFDFKATPAFANSPDTEMKQNPLHAQLEEMRDLPSGIALSLIMGKPNKEKKLSAESIAVLTQVVEYKSQPKETIQMEEAQALELVYQITTSSSPDLAAIERLGNWVASDFDRIDLVEQAIARALPEKPALSAILLLSRLNEQAGSNLLVADTLVECLESKKIPFYAELWDQLAALERLALPETHLLSHKIYDFFHRYMMTVQNRLAQPGKQSDYYRGGFFNGIHYFASHERQHTTNYLLQQHLEDLTELLYAYDSPKPDAIDRLPAGASDEVIYTYRHLPEAYRNRLALGIKEGYSIGRPVFKISPEFYGFYEKNRLSRVYPVSEAQPIDESDYIKKNYPDDEYIYNILNEAPEEPREVYSLLKLNDLANFKKDLKKSERTFYFDLTRISPELHPVMVRELIVNNDRIVGKISDSNEAQPISMQEFESKLFPLRNPSSEERYSYEYLMSLGMRQRIQREFGIELADFDFWVQRNFLSFLEKCSVEKAEQVKTFIKHYGPDALSAFVALEEDPAAGEKLLELSASVQPEHFNKLLHLYSRIATLANGNFDELSQFVKDGKKISPEQIAAVAKQGLFKAQELLSAIKNPEEAIVKLERLSDDTVIFRSFCTTLLKEGDFDLAELKGVELESIEGNTLSEETIQRMNHIVEDNWKSSGELGAKVQKSFREALATKDTAQFYLLKRNNQLLSFVRFDTANEAGERYASSFNVATEIRGSGIGEAMITETLNREAERSVLAAVFSPRLPINVKYVEQTGFVLTEVTSNYEGTRESIFKARCDRQKNGEYLTRSFSQEKIVEQLTDDQKKNLDTLLTQKVVALSLATDDTYEATLEKIKTILSSDFIGTRYIAHPEDPQQKILVFEKIPKNN